MARTPSTTTVPASIRDSIRPWSALSDNVLPLRTESVGSTRMTVRASSGNVLSDSSNHLRPGDVLVETGETIAHVIDHIWDTKSSSRVSPAGLIDDVDWVLVITAGGQVHGTTLLTGTVDILRPLFNADTE